MRYILVLIILILYCLLFKKAAGTLKITKMNVVTFVFLSILFFELIGGSLIYLGFDDHYLIQKIRLDTTIDKTYYILAYICLITPIVIILFNKYIFKIDKTKKNNKQDLKTVYFNKLEENVQVENKENRKKIFYITVVLTIICAISVIYVFSYIGYVPIIKLLDENFDFATERVNISRAFEGNVYIKNIIMLALTPMVSHLAYIYMRITKQTKWKILFVILLILSILVLTHDFSKAPILYYLLFFVIIEITLGTNFRFKTIMPILCILAVIVIILYQLIMGYNQSLLTISSGPLGRIIITQVAALFLHIDAFPEFIPYIAGHSFPKLLVGFLGEGDYLVRSGKLVMDEYANNFVENGTAGVMNTLFVGEAYANFGIVGVIISPILVGIIFSVILAWFIKSKKNPINMLIYIEAFIMFKDVLQGGFVNFIYNVKFVALLAVLVGIKLIIKLTTKKGEEQDNKIEQSKKCIFHVPNYINPAANSGSTRRPICMIEAFKDIGYEVDVVMGDAKTRKKQIKEIEENILDGVKYDFMYSEDSTMPTLLTETHHLPTHPFLDFGFMKFCKKHHIKVGLYYRDIYWQFPFYGETLNKLKKSFALWMYNYDIKQYRKIIDILYLQSMEMAKYLPKTIGSTKIKTLPPGGNWNEEQIEKRKEHFVKRDKSRLNIFYVGGIGNLYDLEPLLKKVQEKQYIDLTICCRQKDWNMEKTRYEKYLNNRINIIHKSGKELAEYYQKADIASLYFPNDEYRKFVLPIKLFEYLENVTPIIATSGTEVAKFITDNDIGWAIPCDENALSGLLEEIHNNNDLLINKHLNAIKVFPKNTWIERAKQVERELK